MKPSRMHLFSFILNDSRIITVLLT